MHCKPEFKGRLFTYLTVPLVLVVAVTSAFGQVTLVSQKDGQVLGDKLGWAVAGAGDVNGDGVPDYIIGEPNADPSGLSAAGKASVYSGSNGSIIYQKNGVTAGMSLGYWVSGAGDVNGDGRQDFILADRSYAFVYSGANGALLYQKLAGGPVAAAGDVNGDGRADFILSNLNSSFVYSGANGALLYQKLGGTSVAGVGDVNGDGRADFAVGDQYADVGYTNGGSVYVYSGATGALLIQKNGGFDYDLFGFSVSGTGDVNGDGRPDFIVGARLADVGGVLNCGAAYVYSGSTGALLYQKVGPADKQLGYAVSGAGDVNADGRDDFMVSSLWNLSSAGSVYVYSGSTGALLSQIDGKLAGDNLGCSISKIGDLNNNGGSEIILGAPLTDPSLRYDAGSSYIYGIGGGSSCQVVAQFVATPTSGTAPVTVNFTDQSTGSPTSWSWNFGDGTTSALRNPSHSYTAAGNYSVTLTASSSSCSNTMTKTNYVTVTAPTSSLIVAAISVVEEPINRKRRGKATVSVMDAYNRPVSGATVTGYFSVPTATSKTATTDANGQAVLYSDQVRKTQNFCFTVTNVTKAGGIYNAGQSITYACEGTGLSAFFGSEEDQTGLQSSDISLEQNYPNPFNPRTEISYSLPAAMYVKLEIYNVLGQVVVTLVDGSMEAGNHRVAWDASSNASGIYYYRLTTDSLTTTKKMLFLK